MLRVRGLLLIALVLVACAPAFSTPLFFQMGYYTTPQAEPTASSFYYDPLTMGDTLNIATLSYSGGTSQLGVTVPGGGFNPQLFLFVGSGAGATLYGSWDNPSGGDLSFSVTGLAAGEYTVVITPYNRDPLGTTLGDGFDTNAPLTWETSSEGMWAYEAWNTVPEPATLGLIGAGLVLIGLFRRGRKA